MIILVYIISCNCITIWQVLEKRAEYWYQIKSEDKYLYFSIGEFLKKLIGVGKLRK